MSSINLDISYRGFRSHCIHNINLIGLAGSGFILLFTMITFLPVPSDILQSTPILNTKSRLYILAITGVAFISSLFIAKWNSTTKYGKIEIDQQQLSIIKGQHITTINHDEIRFLELTLNKKLHLRLKRRVFNFEIEGYQNIKALNIFLYRLKDRVNIKIRD